MAKTMQLLSAGVNCWRHYWHIIKLDWYLENKRENICRTQREVLSKQTKNLLHRTCLKISGYRSCNIVGPGCGDHTKLNHNPDGLAVSNQCVCRDLWHHVGRGMEEQMWIRMGTGGRTNAWRSGLEIRVWSQTVWEKSPSESFTFRYLKPVFFLNSLLKPASRRGVL